MELKNKFSFRLGTSSYIIPDNIIPNVKFLSDKVDDIEIVLFESDEITNMPDQNVINEMISLAKENELSYTIHLPFDLPLGSTNEKIRKNAVAKCLRTIRLMEPVKPFAYILHLIGQCDNMGKQDKGESIYDWLPSIEKSMQELVNAGIDTSSICIENLKYPFETVEKIIKKYDLSICLDIGHILIYGYPLKEYIDKYFSKTKIFHLSGMIDGVDHKDLSHLDSQILQYLVNYINENKTQEQVFTIEIFSKSDFEKSMKVMERFVDY